MSAVERTDLDEELLDEEDRITGALRIVVGCRRSVVHLPLALLSSFRGLYKENGESLDVIVNLASCSIQRGCLSC